MSNDKYANQVTAARSAILAELKRRGLKNDPKVFPLHPDNRHRWHHPQDNYYSGGGVMECPICKTGKLHYSRAAYNGHVHARCTTLDCVAWME